MNTYEIASLLLGIFGFLFTIKTVVTNSKDSREFHKYLKEKLDDSALSKEVILHKEVK